MKTSVKRIIVSLLVVLLTICFNTEYCEAKDIFQDSYIRGYIEAEHHFKLNYHPNPLEIDNAHGFLATAESYRYTSSQLIRLYNIGVYDINEMAQAYVCNPYFYSELAEYAVQSPYYDYYRKYILPTAKERNKMSMGKNSLMEDVVLDWVFDAEYYANAYPDTACLYSDKDTFYKISEKLFEHYKNHGIFEGRNASATFNLNVYKASHPELVAIYGDDYIGIINYYITYGILEGKSYT